jgi:hypothetical protein
MPYLVGLHAPVAHDTTSTIGPRTSPVESASSEANNAPRSVLLGYLTFYVVAFIVYDSPRRSQQLAIVSALAVLSLSAGLTFGPLLGWI